MHPKRNQSKTLFFSALSLLCMASVHAAPLWTFTPQTATTVTVPIDGTATIAYTVTNQSSKAHTLVMMPIAGITQQTGGGNCANPIVLASKGASCTLSLLVTGSQLTGTVSGGPVLCQQGGGSCYQPNQNDILNITIGGEALTTLAVVANAVIPVTNTATTVNLQVTNTGTVTATNVHATLPGGWTAVYQTACATIAPNRGTCSLTFSSTKPYIAQGNIQITGDNIALPLPTTALAFSIDGYDVFAIDSPTSARVMYSSDNIGRIAWDSSAQCTGGNCTQTGATSLTNGAYLNSTGDTYCIITGGGAACNWGAAIGQQPGTGGNAANICYSITTDNTGGVITAGTWYLPAICEMGPSGGGANCPVGTANIYTNLSSLDFGGLSAKAYWSSTEFDADVAWGFDFGVGYQTFTTKVPTRGVRCVRAITY